MIGVLSAELQGRIRGSVEMHARSSLRLVACVENLNLVIVVLRDHPGEHQTRSVTGIGCRWVWYVPLLWLSSRRACSSRPADIHSPSIHSPSHPFRPLAMRPSWPTLLLSLPTLAVGGLGPRRIVGAPTFLAKEAAELTFQTNHADEQMADRTRAVFRLMRACVCAGVAVGRMCTGVCMKLCASCAQAFVAQASDS